MRINKTLFYCIFKMINRLFFLNILTSIKAEENLWILCYRNFVIFCYENLILCYHNNVQCNLQDFAFCTLGHEQYSLATKSPFQAIQRLGCHFRRPLLHCLTHFSYRIGSLEIFHCRQYHALYPRNALNILFTIKFYIFFGELKSLRKILNMN